jgi:hypothetical protein
MLKHIPVDGQQEITKQSETSSRERDRQITELRGATERPTIYVNNCVRGIRNKPRLKDLHDMGLPCTSTTIEDLMIIVLELRQETEIHVCANKLVRVLLPLRSLNDLRHSSGEFLIPDH